MQIDDVEDFIGEARRHLNAWGAEQRRQLSIEIDADGEPILAGWDSQTIERAIMLHGGRAPAGYGQRPEESNFLAERADEIVTAMRRQHIKGEKIKKALYLHYVYKLSYGAGCRMMHMSNKAYRVLKDDGDTWVASALARDAERA